MDWTKNRADAQAYECLATLEGTSTLAQQALVGIQTLNRDELRNLSVYFDRVRRGADA